MEARLIPALPKLEEKMKVCAYARVSTGKDSMLHSLSAQVNYYSSMIQSRNDWSYVGVYSDEAMTGTKSERPGFQRMMADALDGKINMIITKSISRFARNTVTLLESLRTLKEKNVDIFFEEHCFKRIPICLKFRLTGRAGYLNQICHIFSKISVCIDVPGCVPFFTGTIRTD